MSATAVLKRLLAMPREEVRFRASTALRREAARVVSLARTPRWRRSELSAALSRDIPELRPAIAELDRGDWLAAHHSLAGYLVAAPKRFVLAPGDRSERVATIRHHHPGAVHDAVQRADDVAAGRFDLLGYHGLSFASRSDAIDWHFDPIHQRRAPLVFWSRVPYLDPSCGDHKIVWELNRHQYFLALGRAYWLSDNRRYRDLFVTHVESWIAANPPFIGINWSSMLELALRSVSWVWALNLFADLGPERDRSPWLVDLLLALDRQLTLVAHNLSRYFSPNTHLIGEALALYVVGSALPMLQRSGEWVRVGRQVLLEEIARQISPDGGHVERSTHYHRYTLDFYLLALAVARATGDPVAPAFAAASESLARFGRSISDDAGHMPGMGDDDGGALFPMCGRLPADSSDSLQMAAALLGQPSLSVGLPAEEVIWMTGAAAPLPPAGARWPSQALPASGYFVSRSSRGDHLVVDAGPHGFLNGGHAHADALALTLGVGGRPFLIDPGTGCYTVDTALRDRFRSTRYHNTVTIDGRPQSLPAGPFHWESTAHAMPLDWRTAAGYDLFEGSHDGYSPLVHHRTVLSRPGCWVVVDRINYSGGAERHRADSHWHLDPSWKVEKGAGRTSVRARHGDGTTVWVLSLGDACDIFHGASEPDLGWCAPTYGAIVPTSTIRITRDAMAPFALVTVFVESREEPVLDAASVARVSAGASSDDEPIGFTIRTPSWSDTLLFTRRAGQAAGTSIWSLDGLQTDARVLCWRRRNGVEPRADVLVEGRVWRPSMGAVPVAKVPQYYWIPE